MEYISQLAWDWLRKETVQVPGDREVSASTVAATTLMELTHLNVKHMRWWSWVIKHIHVTFLAPGSIRANQRSKETRTRSYLDNTLMWTLYALITDWTERALSKDWMNHQDKLIPPLQWSSERRQGIFFLYLLIQTLHWTPVEQCFCFCSVLITNKMSHTYNILYQSHSTKGLPVKEPNKRKSCCLCARLQRDSCECCPKVKKQ